MEMTQKKDQTGDIMLRDYAPDDFKKLWELDQICFEPGIAYDQRSLRYFLNEPKAVTIVAETHRGSIAGFILIHCILDGKERKEPTGNMVTIDVHPEARRSGLGTRLLLAAEERTKAKGCTWMDLEVSVENAAAIAFYERHGYSITGRIEKYYKDKIDAHIMARKIG